MVDWLDSTAGWNPNAGCNLKRRPDSQSWEFEVHVGSLTVAEGQMPLCGLRGTLTKREARRVVPKCLKQQQGSKSHGQKNRSSFPDGCLQVGARSAQTRCRHNLISETIGINLQYGLVTLVWKTLASGFSNIAKQKFQLCTPCSSKQKRLTRALLAEKLQRCKPWGSLG